MEQRRLIGAPAIPAAAKPAPSGEGDGSALDTILNIINIAFGAGMLGLPYAIQGSGLVFGVFGLGAVLLWNFVCCWLLVELREELTRAREAAPAGSELSKMKGKPTTFAAIGSHAMGTWGVALVHISVIVTLLGASTAYFITANDLLSQTHLYLRLEGWSDDTAMYANTVIYMLLMYPVTCIKSLAPLSKFSGPAIVALIAGFFVVIKLGLDAYGWPSWSEVMQWDALWLPQTFEGFSAFFGVAVFSYGATIIIVEIQESMADPGEFVDSLKTSLWIIWVAYAVLGGITVVIYQQHGEVSANVMSDLEGGEAAQEPLKVFIVMATLLTYPLAMQPVSTVFGHALVSLGLGGASNGSGKNGGYGAVESGTAVATAVPGTVSIPQAEEDDEAGNLSPTMYFGLRAVLVLLTGYCATSVPNFGIVVSLLGSFSVTLGSFVLPPLFHYCRFKGKREPHASMIDLGLCILGAFTCIFCTATTTVGIFKGGE